MCFLGCCPISARYPKKEICFRGRFLKMKVIRLTRLSSSSQSSFHYFTCAGAVVRTPYCCSRTSHVQVKGLVKVFVDNLFDPAPNISFMFSPHLPVRCDQGGWGSCMNIFGTTLPAVTQLNPLYNCKWLQSTPFAILYLQYPWRKSYKTLNAMFLLE